MVVEPWAVESIEKSWLRHLCCFQIEWKPFGLHAVYKNLSALWGLTGVEKVSLYNSYINIVGLLYYILS